LRNRAPVAALQAAPVRRAALVLDPLVDVPCHVEDAVGALACRSSAARLALPEARDLLVARLRVGERPGIGLDVGPVDVACLRVPRESVRVRDALLPFARERPLGIAAQALALRAAGVTRLLPGPGHDRLHALLVRILETIDAEVLRHGGSLARTRRRKLGAAGLVRRVEPLHTLLLERWAVRSLDLDHPVGAAHGLWLFGGGRGSDPEIAAPDG